MLDKGVWDEKKENELLKGCDQNMDPVNDEPLWSRHVCILPWLFKVQYINFIAFMLTFRSCLFCCVFWYIYIFFCFRDIFISFMMGTKCYTNLLGMAQSKMPFIRDINVYEFVHWSLHNSCGDETVWDEIATDITNEAEYENSHD